MSTAKSSNSRARSNSTESLQFEDVPVNPILDKPKRGKIAREYEDRVAGLLSFAMRLCASNERTVADAAAILEYGQPVASKAGDLAEADPRVKKAIDIITSGSENPYAALVLASMPLIAQIMRNHETADLKQRIAVRVPFTKKEISIPFRFKLRNPMLRSLTVPPDTLKEKIFGAPDIMVALQNEGISVAGMDRAET